MTEDDARNLLLVRAVEIEDRGEAILTREDREQAEAAARIAGPGGAGAADLGYLARRASFAAARLATRQPRIGKLLKHSRWPTWLDWAVPLAALVSGLLANEIDADKRLNIIAFPLLGMFAWNLAVYLSLAAKPLVRIAARRRRDTGAGWLARIGRLGQPKLAGQDALTRALARFVGDWTAASGRLAALRGARTLHLAAAAFAVGLIAGLYWRALGIEYRAGWESTFLGPGAVHALVTLLLSPASAVTGMALPDTAGIAAIRWTSATTGGENAGRWIHLHAVTAAGFVVVPRLALALGAALGAFRLARAFPVPGREDFYVRRLLRAAAGGAGEVRVTPYAYTPTPEARKRLEALLDAALGQGARVAFDTPAEYGGEDRWLADASLSPAADHHLVLFNLASTPERENHGAFVAGLAARLAQARDGTALAVLLDEGGYRQRLGGQAGADERLEQRRAAWRQTLAPVVPLPLDLQTEAADDGALVTRLEGALVSDPGLAAVRR